MVQRTYIIVAEKTVVTGSVERFEGLQCIGFLE